MSAPTEKPSKPIPVIDVGQLGLGHEQDPSEHEWQRVGKEIAEAFKELGFVYITRHGIPDEQVERLMDAGAAFFDLSQEEKDKWSRDPIKQQGYLAMDREKFDEKYSHELREAYDIKRTDGLFPDSIIPDFRSASVDFLDSCKKLTQRILIAMALGLDLERDFFVDTHKDMCTDNNASALRLLHYPPVPADIAPDTIRCGAHTDYGTITLLFQDEMGGLYIRDRTGNWNSADPIPGTILVNVGDLLQYWTSDNFIATEHRVLIPGEEVRQQMSRRSVVFFVHPDDPVVITPLNGSTTDYEPVTAKEHVLKRFSETYAY